MEQSNESSQERARLARLAEFRFQLRRFLNFSETEAERLGIATQQYQLMQVIGSLTDEESASISYLAGRMVLRHNSTVELVDRAERAGLVKRTSDERDLRRSLVVLTEHGRAILEQLIASHLRELEGDAGTNLLRSLQEIREGGTEQSASPAAEGTA